ncbi:hypothetical protein CDAR_384241 [Caerostris darwini]|uniref:Uncharacterized protein n=1 Tax=Caerostris darwini TaxID=1538125 RepID=A0AAV4QU95_9ARAC|nr:hypothetical protein CDAR_384241 [Caerostris darwini]
MGAHDKPSIQKHLIGLLMGYSFPDTGAHQQMRYLRKTINNTLDVEREIPDYCVVMVYENEIGTALSLVSHRKSEAAAGHPQCVQS